MSKNLPCPITLRTRNPTNPVTRHSDSPYSLGPISAHSETTPQIPEHGMWNAVIVQAVIDGKDGMQEAIGWLHSKSNRIFSLRWICDQLSISWQDLRERLIRDWDTIDLNQPIKYILDNHWRGTERGQGIKYRDRKRA